jgi:hypothetical protein
VLICHDDAAGESNKSPAALVVRIPIAGQWNPHDRMTRPTTIRFLHRNKSDDCLFDMCAGCFGIQ